MVSYYQGFVTKFSSIFVFTKTSWTQNIFFINSNVLSPQSIQQLYCSKIGLGISPSNSVFPLDVVGSINGDYYYRAGVRQFMGTSNEYSNLTQSQGFINSNVLSTQTIPKIR